MMSFDGYIAAPPTITVFSCATAPGVAMVVHASATASAVDVRNAFLINIDDSLVALPRRGRSRCAC